MKGQGDECSRWLEGMRMRTRIKPYLDSCLGKRCV